MKRTVLQVLGVLCFFFFLHTKAWAHGGVSIEADTCILKIGQFLMHFTGYQPESSGGEEFCEDIPNAGHAIIVMDFVDPQLRKMDTSLRIVRTDSWSSAQAYKLGDEAEEIAVMPPKKYQGGSITFDHSFPEPGYFVGVVTAETGAGQLASIFPFSVGYGIGAFSGGSGGRNRLILGVAVVALAGGALFYFLSRRNVHSAA